MRRVTSPALALLTVITLAACSGNGGGMSAPQPTTAASQPVASVPAASEPAAEGCAPSNGPGAVTVEIAEFEFGPAETTARVGDTVTWNNQDAAPHTATLDDGACETGNISSGSTGGLVFNEAGTFPYHCAIHPDMKGTVTVAE